MAKEKLSIKTFINILGLNKLPKQTEKETIKILNTLAIDPNEQQRLIKSVHSPSKHNTIDTDSIIAYLAPIQEKIEERKFDADQIRELMPEIEQAEAIMIPSILSPNDLQEGSLSFTLEGVDINEASTNKILELFYNHFNDLYNINNKASEWLKSPLYGAGSTPIMIVPPSSIKALVEKENVVSVEQLILKIDSVWENKIYTKGRQVSGVESLSLDSELTIELKKYIKDVSGDNKNKRNRQDNDTKISQLDEAHVGTIERFFIDSMKDNKILSFHEDPTVVGLCSLKRSVQQKKIDATLKSTFKTFASINYKKENVLELPIVEDISENLGNPALLELPPEAVIPIHIPGNPKEHLGYFILLDEFGNPVKASMTKKENDYGDLLSSSHSTMMGGKSDFRSIMNMYSNVHGQVVSKIYENLLDKYLIKQIENVGLDNVDISKNDAVVSCMMRRLFENKSTRVLFVPKELLTYICFAYNDDGTGKSKLDGIKFIMSLRITLMMSRIMAAMEDAINKHKITINFDEKVANPLALMTKIRNKFIESKKLNLSYHPSTIMKSLADKSIMMVPKNIPGLSEFEVDNENGSTTSTRPDSELSDELANMTNLGLGVPPSALNHLSEDEYAKSVATTNLFFSNTIRKYQETYCSFLKNIISTYGYYSKPLRDGIKEILKSSINAENKEEQELDQQKTEELVSNIIDKISISLPKPNIAPDKAQYAELNEFKGMIDEILSTIYPPELLEKDRDAAEGLSQLRAYIKSQIMRKYLITSGFGMSLEIPELDKSLDSIVDINKIYQTVLNFQKGFTTLATKLKESGNEDEEY
jgi:hypothetical protein